MRNVSLLLLLLISSTCKSQILLDDDKQWNIVECIENWCETGNYKINGDSVVNSILYKKVFGYDSTFTYGSFVTLMREESQSVFQLNDSIEELVYDFNLLPSDTFKTVIKGQTVFLKVDSINNIFLLNGEQVRRFYLSEGSVRETWTEGIGSEFGLIYSGFPYWAFINKKELICYTENDTLKYTTGYPNCYYSTTGVEENLIKQISVFPNPLLTGSSLKITGLNNIDTSFKLYDQLGIQVYHSHIQDQVNLLRHPAGIYYYLIQDKDNILKKGILEIR